MKETNYASKIMRKVNSLELGICPNCNRRLSAECGCPETQTLEAQEWYAAHMCAEQELANETKPLVHIIKDQVLLTDDLHTKGRVIVTKSFAERWTNDPKHYQVYYGIDDVVIKK